MNYQLIRALRSLVISILLFFTLMFTATLTASFGVRGSTAFDRAAPVFAESPYIDETTTTAAATTTIGITTTTTVSVTTTARTTTVTETTAEETTTTTEPVRPRFEVASPRIYAGISPNSQFYQERLAIAGDSIAYGFKYYGYIPDIHNIATESVSMWNFDHFTFNYGAGDMGLIDAVDYIRPKLLYMSLGMNDVNMNYPDSFTTKYADVIYQILEKVPDISIVVAGITPVTAECDYISNEIIREYNYALETMVMEIDSPRVCYFDAYSVVCDEYLDLRYECTSGDGIHLEPYCYSDILTALFDFLDTTSIPEQMMESE